MKRLKFKDFLKKCILKNDTRIEYQLQKSYNYPIYPRDSKIYSDKVFVKTDNGRMVGSDWTCFFNKR